MLPKTRTETKMCIQLVNPGQPVAAGMSMFFSTPSFFVIVVT
jgi:hypothetical protein